MMGGKRCRMQGFTLIETVTVIALLAVITTTASVALVKMLGLWRQARTAALIDQKTRQVMLDLSQELRSARALLGPPDVPLGTGALPSNILIYDLGEGRWCTVRLEAAGEEHVGLVKEIRSDLRRSVEPISREVLISDAVGFRVRYTTSGRRQIMGAPSPETVGLTVWVEGMERGRGPRAYATAASIPMLVWPIGT
jgi:prepilin-type N-terminal cleavage/methylation domain-containing protein